MPVSEHRPGFWLVERPGPDPAKDRLDPVRGLAFNPAPERWWIWEPATERFHADTPWLEADWRAVRDHPGKTGVIRFGARVRFSPLTIQQVADLIDSELVGGADARWIERRRTDRHRHTLEAALAAAVDPEVPWDGRWGDDPGVAEIDPRWDGFELLDASALEGSERIALGPYVECERTALAEEGGSVAVAAAALGVLTAFDLPHGLPADGWRVVSLKSDRAILAAPHPLVAGTWVLLFLTRDSVDAPWTFAGAQPDPVRPLPDRAARARSLALSFEAPAVARVGQRPVITVAVTNASSRTLGGPGDRVYAEDDLTAVGWLSDGDGRPLPAATGIPLWGEIPGVPRLLPGSRVRVPVRLMTQDIERLEPGRYGVCATLISFGIEVAGGVLVVS